MFMPDTSWVEVGQRIERADEFDGLPALKIAGSPKVRLTPPEPSVVDGIFELSYGRKAA